MIVSAPDMDELEIPLGHTEISIDVRVWGDEPGRARGRGGRPLVHEFLEFPCRLVRKPDDDPRLVDSSFAQSGDQVSFADGSRSF